MLQQGDLVFINNASAPYILTTLGSWGYVCDPVDYDYDGERTKVKWHRLAGGFGSADGVHSVDPFYLSVLPDPPESKADITALVRVLARLEAGV